MELISSKDFYMTVKTLMLQASSRFKICQKKKKKITGANEVKKLPIEGLRLVKHNYTKDKTEEKRVRFE